MPRRPARFTEADVARALKGAERAGMRVSRVEIGADGSIVLVPEGATPAASPSSPETELAAWMEKRRGAGVAQGG